MVGKIGSCSAAVLAGLISAALMLSDAPRALAHPGGLAADGCHKDRRNGGRHCHGSGSAVTLATPGKAKGKRKAKRKAKPKSAQVQRLFGGGGGNDVYYANCSEVRAAGAAPIRSGDPGYSRRLDRDGDGVACE